MKEENFSEERKAFGRCLADAREYINKITAFREIESIEPEEIKLDYISGEIDSARKACESALENYTRVRECIAEEMGSDIDRFFGILEKKDKTRIYRSIHDIHKSGVELESEFLGFWMPAKREIDVLVNKISILSGEAGYSITAHVAMELAKDSAERAAEVFLRYNIKGFPRETDPGFVGED